MSANAWEEVKRKGRNAIEKWIEDYMKYLSCAVVFVGAEMAEHP